MSNPTELEQILERFEVRTYQATRANPELKIGQIPNLLTERDKDQAAIQELIDQSHHAGEVEGGKKELRALYDDFQKYSWGHYDPSSLVSGRLAALRPHGKEEQE